MTNPLPGKIIPDIIPGRRRKRLHSITGKQALRLGFSPDRCAEIFHEASKDVRWEYMRWLAVEYKERDGERHRFDGIEDYCYDCAEKVKDKKKAEYEADGCTDVEVTIDGWNESFERDGPEWCESCGVLLHHSLTEYGIYMELVEPLAEPMSGEYAAILANLAGGIGDLREEHHGKLAQIALATWWEREHGNWAENPLVTIVEPNQLTPMEREEAERLSAEFEADVARGVAKGLDPKGDV